jgi:hypothetical protein
LLLACVFASGLAVTPAAAAHAGEGAPPELTLAAAPVAGSRAGRATRASQALPSPGVAFTLAALGGPATELLLASYLNGRGGSAWLLLGLIPVGHALGHFYVNEPARGLTLGVVALPVVAGASLLGGVTGFTLGQLDGLIPGVLAGAGAGLLGWSVFMGLDASRIAMEKADALP